MDCSVGDYEVFLSFRGADTRQGFTDILHEYMTTAEIRVFRDDDELAIGDKIESILAAISNSKICIPIFSPKFAESKWCLREVSKMVELKKKIVPVFYKVTPDDVKLKEGSLYSDDFRNLEENHRNHKEITKWKNALREAASNKGRELGGKSYTKFCKELVDEILSKLGPRKKLGIDDFVGVDNKKEAMKLLDMESSEEVICLGLYGMGGIGKTTIAKLIYNEFLSSFDHCSFVPDIREFSKSKGVNGLPKYLFDNLHPKSVAEFNRPEQIAERLNKKKVLIVLDDVDSCEQIQEIAKDPSRLFGSGSRIIVTTRDKDVLEEYKVLREDTSEIRYMEMKELESGWAVELFSKCAFGKVSPPYPYQHLSERAVASAGGLPLAITVIAKYLRNKKEAVWEEIIERLKRTPPKEVKDKLLISYEVLEDEQKVIFLDIACLFIGHPHTETSSVFYMWQGCSLCPRWSLEVLQSRSLVKTDQHGWLTMHDQLRDLGRDIVKTKSNGDLTKQSRLWEHSQGLEVLKCEKKMKENIEAVRLLNDKSVENTKDKFTHEGFVGFDKLRILEMGRATLQGDFSNLLPQLRWFQCRYILEARNLVLPNLVILDLSGSDVDENWDGWSQIQALQKLKILDLSWCQSLQKTPIFAENMALQRLELGCCYNLAYVDSSIGKLQHLTYLSFFDGKKLKNLPDSLGKLHCLGELDLRRTSIVTLPDSIGRLEKLERLNLEKCESLGNLPESLGNLRSLVSLNISYTKITKLPSFIGGGPEKLKSLDLCGLVITLLPDSYADLRSLVHLDLSGSKITELPDFTGRLENLQRLKLSWCREIQKLPNSLGELKSLEELDLSGSRITELPQCIGGLEKLRGLELSGSKIIRLPSTIKHLSLLHVLKLDKCLEELPELPISLRELSIRSHVLKEVPDVSSMKDLTSLEVSGSAILVWNGSFPGKLEDLRIELLYNISTLPDLSSCSQLRRLTLRCMHSLEVLPSLSGLRTLVKLEIESCKELTTIPGFGKLQSLTSLRIRKCPSLESLENLRGLQALRHFQLLKSEKLTEISGLGKLQSLHSLRIEYCTSLAVLENLRDLNELTEFSLVGCQKLIEIPGLGELRGLTSLNIKNCTSLVSLENLRELNVLKRFTLVDCQNLIKIPGLGELRGLTSLNIQNCTSLVSLENLRELNVLKRFTLVDCQNLIKIPGLGQLQCLADLYIDGCPSLVSLENLTELKELERLVNCRMRIEIPGFGNFEGKGDAILEMPNRFSDLEYLCDNSNGYNQTLYDEQNNLSTEQVSEEEVRHANMLWPKMLQHHLHKNHQLLASLRGRGYICDGCQKEGRVWSYHCEECDFDLHYECALKKKNITTITIREQSSIVPSGSHDVICCLDRFSCCLPILSCFRG